MTQNELNNYIEARKSEGLTKIEVTLEVGDTTDDFYVTKTKETFVYGLESEADEKIDAVRLDPGFAAADKKFKAGKVSKKTGEELTPDTYTVVIKLNH